jgi:hypothetical protein
VLYRGLRSLSKRPGGWVERMGRGALGTADIESRVVEGKQVYGDSCCTVWCSTIYACMYEYSSVIKVSDILVNRQQLQLDSGTGTARRVTE